MISSYKKAGAQAKARPGQANVSAFGLACDFTKPKPPKARPKPGLSGQAGAGTSLGAMKDGKKMNWCSCRTPLDWNSVIEERLELLDERTREGYDGERI